MRFIKIIISTVIVLLGIVFIVENLDMLKQAVHIKLDLYFFTFQSPGIHLWVIILFCFFLGVLTTSLYGIYELVKSRQTIRQLRHNLEILASELKQAGATAEISATAPKSRVVPPSEE
ncbi:MAG: LapA family protein [Thermodesulfobacteriota bacterium]